MNYYLSNAGAAEGPYPPNELMARGLHPETLVWNETMPQWLRADQTPELRPLVAPMAGGVSTGGPVPMPGAGPYPTGPYPGGPIALDPATLKMASDKKTAAGLCAILVGSFGVHKFVLGYTTAGLIMLLSTVLTCFVAGIVMHVISIIEGINYLRMTDAEFYMTHMVNKRDWF